MRAHRPLRVLYSFPHRLGAPGIGTTALHQVRGAIDEGHDVFVVCASLGAPLDGATRVVETMVVAGRRVPHRALGISRALRHHDRRVATLLRRTAGDFDLVHTWPLGARSTLEVARARGIAGLREAPNAHTAVAFELAQLAADAVAVELPRAHSHRPNSRKLAHEEAEYELASAILVPSRFVERTFRERLACGTPLLRHRYGYDPERFPAPPPRRPARPFTAAFVGSGEPRKGLHIALAAWRTSGVGERGARLVVCGRLLPAYHEALAQDLHQAGVEVRPFSSDVGAVLRSCDALVLPSYEEGSALVTYEAQASGCALLVSEAAGALMVDGRDGLVHRVGDAAALGDHLRWLADDGDILADMRQHVLARRRRLSWARAAVRLSAVYASAAAAARSGRSSVPP